MKRCYVDTPEGQIHYITEGNGEPLVLLHQGHRSSRMYVKLIPLLSSDYWVIAMDLLGFGNSDALPWNNATVPDRARNVNHFIAALGIDKCQLFGLHTGAALGAEVAAAWPEKVRALILFGFPYIESEEERQQIYAHLERSTGVPPTDIAADWTPMKISPDGSHLTVLWARVYSEVLRYWMHSPPPWAPDFYPNPLQSVHRWATPDVLGFMERWTLDYLQRMTRSARAMWRAQPPFQGSVLHYDFWPRLPLIKAPTLLIDADSPCEVFPCRRNQEVKELIPNSEAVVLPDSDDNAAEWRAAQLAEMMLEFLRKHPL